MQLPETMQAMVLRPRGISCLPEMRLPKPGPGQVLVKVHACGVCRTDLHVVDGELPNPAADYPRT
jgi:propanol-preferring alcohol dehydrogenase